MEIDSNREIIYQIGVGEMHLAFDHSSCDIVSVFTKCNDVLRKPMQVQLAALKFWYQIRISKVPKIGHFSSIYNSVFPGFVKLYVVSILLKYSYAWYHQMSFCPF